MKIRPEYIYTRPRSIQEQRINEFSGNDIKGYTKPKYTQEELIHTIRGYTRTEDILQHRIHESRDTHKHRLQKSR